MVIVGPSVDLCQHQDFLVDRFELLAQPEHMREARRVVDDITAVSPETDLRLHELAVADPWDLEEVHGALDDFARSQDFDTEAEDYFVHVTTGTHVEQICLFLLAESRRIPARILRAAPPKRGEELGSLAIVDLELSRYDRLARRFDAEHQEGRDFLKDGIATRNVTFNRLIERVEQVALVSDSPLLLLGSTGTGKSRLARRIHELKRSRRRVEGELVEVNCATLRGETAMSTLFGHVKGAFTGAQRDRAGLLRQADGGQLFLDEIGDLGLDEQAMLLRALEQKRFLPMGSDREVESDFQLIAGTHRDLRARVREGLFREDLLARIDLWSFELPDLARRPEDIEPNVQHELERFRTTSGHVVAFNKEARRRFLDFAQRAPWPGNFRELRAAIERMATLASGGRIDEPLVAEEIERLESGWARFRGEPSRQDAGEHVATCLGEDVELDLFERTQLETVLEVCRRARSLSAAGRELFSVSRQQKRSSNDADRLRKYLARHDLRFQDLPSPS
ncbi:MAG: RNA repair transcriptional activator RtcR [Acidobacteriota bacterium]